jgi:putative oxidoreductase
MAIAMATVHRGKPIWADRGGGELPLTNAAAATALILAGSGRYSLDQALGLALPDWVALAAAAGAAVTIGAALATRTRIPLAGHDEVPAGRSQPAT